MVALVVPTEMGYASQPILPQPHHPILVEENGRTEHLPAPYLSVLVITGSPKRAALHRPAWRRSHHISQRLTVTRQTAAGLRTVMAETYRATGTGMPSNRVKGGASARGNLFMTTPEVR